MRISDRTDVCSSDLRLDLGEESGAVHGAVECHRSGYAGQPQGADERGGLPVAVRDRCAAALAARGAPTEPGHLCGSAGLVDKDQALGIEVRLVGDPGRALGRYVSALLLARVRCLFFYVTPCCSKNRHTVLGTPRSPWYQIGNAFSREQ